MLRIVVCMMLLPALAAQAQSKSKPRITFHNQKNEEVKEQDAAYRREITKSDTGAARFQLREFYLNGKPKRSGAVVSAKGNPLFEGLVVSYDKEGVKTAEQHYRNNRLEGTVRHYYANGQLRREYRYVPPAPSGGSGATRNEQQLISYFTEDGVPLLQDGNGHIRFPDDNKGDYSEGMYKNGRKESNWEGTFQGKRYRYEEQYKNGILISGVTVDQAGRQYLYNTVSTLPAFPGHVRGFSEALRELDVHGDVLRKMRGRLVASLRIDTVGKIKDVTIIEAGEFDTGDGVVRLLRQINGFTPAMERGVPVESDYRMSYSVSVERSVTPAGVGTTIRTTNGRTIRTRTYP